jgi:hypothetical protein
MSLNTKSGYLKRGGKLEKAEHLLADLFSGRNKCLSKEDLKLSVGKQKWIYLRAIYPLILNKHRAIKHLFFKQNFGLKLFRLESDIILEACHRCGERDIIAVPIHDCVACRLEDYQAVDEIIKEAYLEHTGHLPETKVKIPVQQDEMWWFRRSGFLKVFN